MNEVPLVQREPFLGLELERLQAELGQHVGRLADLAVEEHLASPASARPT